MKFIILLFFFVTIQSFASNKCLPEVKTLMIDDNAIKSFRVSDNHKSFTAFEKKLIYLFISTSDDYFKFISREGALRVFADYNDYKEIGTNAGQISYFQVNRKVFAVIEYFPGDNQFGAVYEISQNRFPVKVGQINDGDFECK